MRLLALLMCCLVLLGTPASAQDEFPIPQNLEPITPENASNLRKLASIGAPLPGTLAWFADGTMLGVGTTEGIYLYDAASPDREPRTIPGGPNFAFETPDELISNGQRWNIETGEKIGEAELPSTTRFFSPGGEVSFALHTQDEGGNVLELKQADGEITATEIPNRYRLNRVFFSQDERFAAVVLDAYLDEQHVSTAVHLWNVADGILVADLPLPTELVNVIAFHADDTQLITAYDGYFAAVMIWDVETGEPIDSGAFAYPPLRFSPDGRLLAFRSLMGIMLWSDHALGTLNHGSLDFPGTPMFLFSPDGYSISTVTPTEILLWQVNTDDVPEAPYLMLPTNRLAEDIFYSSDGLTILAVEEDGVVEIWDANTGEKQSGWQAEDSIIFAQLSPDDQFLRGIVRGDDDWILWEVETGQIRLTVPRTAVFDEHWSQAAYWDNGQVHIIDLNTSDEIVLPAIEAYMGEIAALNAALGWAVFSGEDIRGYDLQSGELIFSQAFTERAPQVKFSADNKHFITRTNLPISEGNQLVIQVWNTARPPQLISSFQIPSYGSDWLPSPDAKFIAQRFGICGDGGGGYEILWHTATSEQLLNWSPDLACGPYSHTFTPDGGWLIVGWDYLIHIVNLAAAIKEGRSNEGNLIRNTSSSIFFNTSRLKNITLSPDGSMLAVSLSITPYEQLEPETEYRIVVFELDYSTEPLDDAVHTQILEIPDARSVVFSPDGQWLATDNGFWNVATGEQLESISAQVAAFTPDSTVPVTYDGEQVFVWDTERLAQGEAIPRTTLEVDDVEEIAFDPSGSILYLRRVDEVQVWGVPTR